MNRIEPVGNPWLDAGIVPFSTVSENNKASNFDVTDTKPLYLEDKKEWKKWVPVDFITESFPGQFKNWFYSLIAMSTVMENINPFKTVLGYSTCVAEDGRPMHKSWGNAIEFNEGAEKIGVDVMRWMYARQNPSDNLLFGYNVASEVRRSFHLKIWNTYNYFVTYANLSGWVPQQLKTFNYKQNSLDKWIISRLVETEKSFSDNLDNYEPHKATEKVEKFVEDLSNWYVRRSRDRATVGNENEKDKNAFFETLYFVLKNLTLIIAPITPFMSEMIYSNLTKETSIHLADWPDLNDYDVDKKLSDGMEDIRKFAEKIHSVRKDLGLPVRQPLQEVEVKGDPVKYSPELATILCDEVNVKKVVFSKSAKTEIKLDTKITPELQEEAKYREFVRLIQNERKNLGVSMSDYVNVSLDWLPMNTQLLDKLQKVTLTQTLTKGEFKVTKI
jgi:isoleucyl-tRNA synthetase